MRTNMLAFVIAASLAPTATAQEIGQEQQAAERDAGEAPTELEQVTVTAQYRPESQKDIPLAITAFSDLMIQDAGIETPADFVALTPNLSYDESFTVGNSFLTVRGVQQLNNGDAPMAIVVDGVPQNNQKQFKMELYDVERIEVLRGPQGALYGRNAVGGAINIVTKAPTEDVSGFVQAGVGNGGQVNGRGAVGGAIGDGRLRYRVALSAESFDGIVDNSFLDEKVDFYDSQDARLRLTWQPRENLDLDFRVAGSWLEGGAIYDTSFDPAGDDNTNREQAPLGDTLGDSERRITDLSMKLDWRLGFGTLTAITGYTDLGEDYRGDLDFCNPVVCPGGLFGLGPAVQSQDLDVQLLSQELRLSSPGDRPLTWTAGAYWLRTDRDLATVGTLTAIPLDVIDSQEFNDNTAWAVFGQMDYAFTPATKLTASLRYDEDRREQTDAATGARRRIAFDALQPRLSLGHKIGDDHLAYATYATGFRSGGFNGIGGRPFEDERLESFEVGFKSSWLDQRLLFNAALFRQVSEDYQFFFVDLDAGGAQVIDNIDEVEMRGVELEARWLVTKGFELSAGYGRLLSEITELDGGLSVPAQVGNKAPRTQDYELSLGGQWNFRLGSRRGMFRIDAERRGPRTWQADNVEVMDAFNLLNARFTLYGDRWSLTAWGRNLTDAFYYTDFVPNEFSGLGRDVAFPARGRTVGVELRLDF